MKKERWIADEHSSTSATWLSYVTIEEQTTKYKPVAFVLIRDGVDEEQAIERARVAAAAPEMLDALKGLVEMLKGDLKYSIDPRMFDATWAIKIATEIIE